MPANAVDQYRSLLPQLETFRMAFEGLIRSLLAKEEIQVQHVESRCKKIDSFEEKVDRKGYEAPLEEMTDLLGVRLILYYQDHVRLAAELIKNEFSVDEANSSGERMPESADQFGYRSYHLVVALDQRRAVLPEWSLHASQKVEIQIRSVLDHAWASIDHELFYQRKKRGKEPEPRLKRKFARLMGLLEQVDEGFTEVRDLLEEAGVLQEAGIQPVGPVHEGDTSGGEQELPDHPR